MSANRKAYIVGLTGGIASGKSEAARHLSALGACCVDADAISHALTAPGGALLGVIRETFGDEVFLPDGTLNRRALGEVVFNDPAKRLILDSITHPAIQKAIMDDIERAVAAGENLVFINVPLLFETGMDALCDECWVVSLDRETQIKRLMARDALTASEAEKRIESQMSQDDKLRRANVVIKNGRPIELTHAELNGLLRDLRRRLK